eukprot:7478221-Pyramimonas_sp.AAC.1
MCIRDSRCAAPSAWRSPATGTAWAGRSGRRPSERVCEFLGPGVRQNNREFGRCGLPGPGPMYVRPVGRSGDAFEEARAISGEPSGSLGG